MFIGRKVEMASLNGLLDKKTASLVIVKGRRRIGKSRLIEEFASNHTFIRIAGLAPNKHTTVQSQHDIFAKQLSHQTALPKISMDDWSDLFILLSQQVPATGKVIILLDEISWMGSKDADFSAKLKDAWDFHLSKHENLICVLCGSVSSWIEKEIIKNTAFLGRPSLHITLQELSLRECNEFWGDWKTFSAYEKLKLLCVTGGVPRYLELINPKKTSEENIRTLCFQPSSPLLDEFDRIFSDVFGSRSNAYKSIIEALIQRPLEQADIFAKVEKAKSGWVGEYFNDLEVAGFIRRDYTWSIKTKKSSKLSKYRIKDCYLRFYLKNINQCKQTIMDGEYINRSLESLPGWDSILGLQFENLVQNNRLSIIDILNINIEDVISCGPYFQRQTKRRAGCQIDLMIQTKQGILYICEIKFSKNPISQGIISELNSKIEALDRPKHVSCLPVLIHVNGTSEELDGEQYFYKTITFGDLLTKD